METGEDLPDDPLNTPYIRMPQRPTYRLGSTKEPLDPVLEELANQLVLEFGRLFNKTFDAETAEVPADHMFEIQQARAFALAVKKGLPLTEITQVIGGEMIEGQMEHLKHTVVNIYCTGSTYQVFMEGNIQQSTPQPPKKFQPKLRLKKRGSDLSGLQIKCF
jgi:hypothetical protein